MPAPYAPLYDGSVTLPVDGYVLTNAVAHAAGVVLFATFLGLVFLRRPSHRVGNGLPLLAAGLALFWNLASLAVLTLGSHQRRWEEILAALGFSLLSLLPAVLLQLCAGTSAPWVVRAGYGLSAIAIGCHLGELLFDAASLHRVGLLAITVGFGILTSVVVLRVLWRKEPAQPRNTSRTMRTMAVMSLFLFAISFAHFSHGPIEDAWSQELLLHHAGIPLALFVLLQDYRFVLADAFIRVMANVVLAVLFGWGAVAVSSGASPLIQIAATSAFVGGFGYARSAAQRLLTRLVFRQPDQLQVETALNALRSFHGDEAGFLRAAGDEMARTMNAECVDVEMLPDALLDLIAAAPVDEVRDAQVFRRRGVAALVPVRISGAETRLVLLGERSGGRPYLSLDLDVLSRLAAGASEQMERIRAQETHRLVTQAELRALQSQIHPHFLFNAFNTLYGIIPREAKVARQTVLHLADIFRYFLRTDRALVPLEEELQIVRAYLAIEAQRLGGKLKIEMSVADDLLRELIPVLSIEPLVENAVKHGVAAAREGGTVFIEVVREGDEMVVAVSDTGHGDEASPSSDGAGVGLENVSRRLQLCFGPDARVSLERSVGMTRVSFRAPCNVVAATVR